MLEIKTTVQESDRLFARSFALVAVACDALAGAGPSPSPTVTVLLEMAGNALSDASAIQGLIDNVGWGIP